jgi:ribosomal protein S18 acetylase RimI-like enzyme
MTEYKEEKYDEVINEIKPLLDLHYEEIALDKDVIKLNPDYDAYKSMNARGVIKIISARQDGKLIGYCICVVKGHLHYKDSLTAHNDIFYIKPEYRQGLTGVKLFKATEEIMKKYGVQRIIMNVKRSNDIGAIFERLGYKETERVYTKIIG